MRRLRLLTGGESHGPAVTAILEGIPAGLELDRDRLDGWLARRQHGFGRGGRQRIERDRVEVTGGVRGGVTLGSPLVLVIRNLDHANWAAAMDPWRVDPAAVERVRRTAPRPGHADLAGGLATDQLHDMRNVLERASARETAARVAAGAVCAQLLSRYGIRLRSGVLAVGGETVVDGPPTWELLGRVDPGSPLVTPDPEGEERLVEAVRAARSAGDTLGGVVGAVARGVPPGLGSYVEWDRRLDARLAAMVMSIPSVKAVAVGAGPEVAGGPGSQAHDPVIPAGDGTLHRQGNRAGGVEGGVSNGEDVAVRAWLKPIATLRRGLPTVDLASGRPETSAWERSDTTAIAAAPVIVEAVLALVVADALLEKLGGDCIADLDAAWRAYLARLGRWWRPEEGGGSRG